MAIVLNFGALSIATTYSLSGPTTGLVDIDTADFSVTPNGPYVGTITVRVSMNSFPVGISPIVLSWNGTFETQRFSFVPPFAGTYALDATNDGSLVDALELLCLIGTPYYVSTIGSGGNGSIGSPWGIADLYSTTTTAITRGVAMTTLRAGDAIYFRGGSYSLPCNVTADLNSTPLISPTHSGTASQPITLAAYPGETPVFTVSAEMTCPTFGCNGISYVQFIGLTVHQSTYGGADSLGHPCFFFLGSTGSKVSYCECIGNDNANLTDNTDAIAFSDAGLAFCYNCIVEHCDVHGFLSSTSSSQNTCGFKNYGAQGLIVQDNYFHNNNVGIYDKNKGILDNTVYRRNWITGNTVNQFLGPGFSAGDDSTPNALSFYDNVIDGALYLENMASGHTVNNNLFRTTAADTEEAINFWTTDYLVSFFNNIVIPATGNPKPIATGSGLFSTTGPTAPLQYADYNVYVGTPSYQDTGGNRTQAYMQGLGFELVSVSDTTANIFVDTTDYALKGIYPTFGRYADAVGPRPANITVAQLLNTSRYGPAARP